MIASAAIKKGDRIWTGRRHEDVIRNMIRQDDEMPDGGVYGFVVDDGQFLDRFQAFKHAVQCGQVDDPDDGAEHILTSKDL